MEPRSAWVQGLPCVAFVSNLLGGTADLAMNLETGTGRKIANPLPSQIAEELTALPGGVDSFAILSRDAPTYIQTSGSPSEGFVLEYQATSTDQHYRSIERALPLGTVANAFQLYAAEDPAWRSLVSWERDDLGQYSSGFPALPVALVLAALLGLVLWWWRERSG